MTHDALPCRMVPYRPPPCPTVPHGALPCCMCATQCPTANAHALPPTPVPYCAAPMPYRQRPCPTVPHSALLCRPHALPRTTVPYRPRPYLLQIAGLLVPLGPCLLHGLLHKFSRSETKSDQHFQSPRRLARFLPLVAPNAELHCNKDGLWFWPFLFNEMQQTRCCCCCSEFDS